MRWCYGPTSARHAHSSLSIASAIKSVFWWLLLSLSFSTIKWLDFRCVECNHENCPSTKAISCCCFFFCSILVGDYTSNDNDRIVGSNAQENDKDNQITSTTEPTKYVWPCLTFYVLARRCVHTSATKITTISNWDERLAQRSTCKRNGENWEKKVVAK